MYMDITNIFDISFLYKDRKDVIHENIEIVKNMNSIGSKPLTDKYNTIIKTITECQVQTAFVYLPVILEFVSEYSKSEDKYDTTPIEKFIEESISYVKTHHDSRLTSIYYDMNENVSNLTTEKCSNLIKSISSLNSSIEDKCVDIMNDDAFDTYTKLGDIKDILESSIDSEISLTEGVIDNAKSSVKQAARTVSFKNKQYSQLLNSKLNRSIKDARESSKQRSYDKLINRTVDVTRILKTAMGGGVAALIVGPYIAAVGLLAKVALDKKTELKHKKRILFDLKTEKVITEEKIKIADRNGDDKTKIKLMRINEELSRNIERIRYNVPD
jgi:hypothetical protein